MKIEHVREIKWSNKNLDAIDCIVKFDKIETEIPFTAKSNDVEQHGRDLYNKIVSGEYGEIDEFIDNGMDTDTVKTEGNYNEEYLKSLIYQVIDEINESKI
jgi:hypothetical protein